MTASTDSSADSCTGERCDRPVEDEPSRRSVLAGLALLAPALGLSGRELLAVGTGIHAHASSTAAAGAAGEPATWKILTGAQRRLVAAWVDTLLPETDTPSASAAGVVEFVDLLVAEWYPEDARTEFLKKLELFRLEVAAAQGSEFASLPAEKRLSVLQRNEAEAIEARGGSGMRTAREGLADQSFFDLMKWMTVWGYYTSEEGLRQERGYRIVPGRYQPDVLYSGIG